MSGGGSGEEVLARAMWFQMAPFFALRARNRSGVLGLRLSCLWGKALESTKSFAPLLGEPSPLGGHSRRQR